MRARTMPPLSVASVVHTTKVGRIRYGTLAGLTLAPRNRMELRRVCSASYAVPNSCAEAICLAHDPLAPPPSQ